MTRPRWNMQWCDLEVSDILKCQVVGIERAIAEVIVCDQQASRMFCTGPMADPTKQQILSREGT